MHRMAHSDTGRINPPCICKGSRIDPPFDFDPHKFIHICTIQSNPMFGLQSEYTQSLRVHPILSQFSTIQSNPITGLCQLRQSPPSPLHTLASSHVIQSKSIVNLAQSNPTSFSWLPRFHVCFVCFFLRVSIRF
jgi:hypothetical protein